MRLSLLLCLLPLPALAEIEIHDPIAVRAYPAAPTGAVYATLANTGDTADRLVSVTADLARRAQLHATTQNADGTMGMVPQDGLDLPAGAEVALQPGGLHVMLLGLAAGDAVTLTLSFETADDLTVTVPWGSAPDAMPQHGADHESMPGH